jgi:heat shock protein HtpX
VPEKFAFKAFRFENMTTTNALKTAFLLGLLSALLLIAGQALGGRQGLYVGLGLAVLMNFSGYFFSDKIALSMYSAQPVTETENTAVYRRVAPLVGNLCGRMGLPMPRLWLIPQESPNAFATGRNPQHASVAFTAGILGVMDDRELEGVVAHELGHVLHRDILISSVAATIAAAITMLASMARWAAIFGGMGRRDDEENGGGVFGYLFMLILAPIAALLIQMAISRTREYSADAAAAKYTGTPYGLVSALTKLESWSKRIPMDASPATAHMFIIKPFTGQFLMNLFSTHPSTEQRIARLQAIR